jgi:hypothetical protein
MAFISNVQEVERLARSVIDQAGVGGSTPIGDSLARKFDQSPQMDYLFMVELPDLSFNKAGATFANAGGFDEEGVGAEEINHRVYAVTAPFIGFDSNKNVDGGTFMYTAGHSDIGSVNLTVDEMEDGATLDYFIRWQKKIKNDNGTYNPPYNYKRNIRLIRLSAAKMMASVSTYTDYFPTGISEANHNNDSNGVLQYQITLTGDTVEHTIIKPKQLKDIINENNFDIIGNLSEELPEFDPVQAQGILQSIAGRFG